MTILAWCAAVPAGAATFYLDSVAGSDANTSAQAQSQSTPWQHMPGMSGTTGSARSYTAQAGDVFVLKGGSTWTFASTTDDLLTVPASGITIQGGQQLATPWGSGYPVLDGTGSAGTRRGILANAQNGITIDGIKIFNTVYVPSGSGFGVMAYGDSGNWEIKNCYFDSCGICSVSYGPGNGANALLHDNTVINCGRFQIQPENVTFDNVQIYSNLFLGTGNYNPQGYHCDGIMIGANVTTHPSTFTNIRIHHNRFSGDWRASGGATALIYLNDSDGGHGNTWSGGYHAYIYENQLCIDSDGILSPAFIYIESAWKDVQIFNNTFNAVATVNPISMCISEAYMNSDAGLVISNNIFAGTANAVNANLSHGAGLECDYNLYWTTGRNHLIWDQNNRWDTLAACQAAGYEAHGQIGDPKFAALPNGTCGSGNWALLTGSAAIGKGINLSSLFATGATDANGSPCPLVGAWTLGAYQSVLPAPPTALRVTGGVIANGTVLH